MWLPALAPLGTVRAESITQALISAYENSPKINAERARLRAADEELARAQAGYRPIIEGAAEATAVHSDSEPPSSGNGDLFTRNYSLTLSQPIFDGFQTSNAVKEADSNINASRELLRGIEQTILLEVVTAYVNVIRDRAIVGLRENNVSVLARELRATEDRFAVGEVTKTDVAQARARRAQAVSDLDFAQATLQASLAEYERAVGHPASNLPSRVPIIKALPGSLQQAIDIAMAEHPDVVSAAFLERATEYSVGRIKAEMLPDVTLEANYQKRFDPSPFVEEQEAASITGRLRVPFYERGEVSARVRQAKQNQQGRVLDIQFARERVKAQVASAWSQLQSAKSKLISDEEQVSSSQIALDGVREEEKVGQRTLLDVLDAERDLLNAKVARIGTQRDIVLASYTVLAAIGRLTATDLGLGVEAYDVEEHYQETNHKWWGTTVEREEGYVGYELEASGWTAETADGSSSWAAETSGGEVLPWSAKTDIDGKAVTKEPVAAAPSMETPAKSNDDESYWDFGFPSLF